MVNEEFILEWTDALRSGNYAKGQGQLHSNNDTYCCLGVACELLVEKGILQRTIEPNARSYTYTPTEDIGFIDEGIATLPVIAAQYIGMDVWGHIADVEDDPQHEYTTLTRVNDSSKTTFDDVADVIETVAFGDNTYVFGQGEYEIRSFDGCSDQIGVTYGPE